MTYWLKQLNICPKDGTRIVQMKSPYKSRFGQARTLDMYGCPKCRRTFVEYRRELIVSPFYKDILKDFLNWSPSSETKQEEKKVIEKKPAVTEEPMTRVEYNGISYLRNEQGKWFRDGSPVFSNLQKILDELYYDKHADELESTEQKMKIAEGLYRNGSYSHALSAYLGVFDLLDSEHMTDAMEKICESYRLSGDPEMTIEFYNDNREKCTPSADALTSVAAAYLDIGVARSAKKMADHACNMYPFNRELPPNLVAVYERLNGEGQKE